MAGSTNITSFMQPFNPITLNFLLIGLSIVGYINSTFCQVQKIARGRERDKDMVNIYERLLGDSYKRLHPKLQNDMRITKEIRFIGEGEMDEIYGGSFFR